MIREKMETLNYFPLDNISKPVPKMTTRGYANKVQVKTLSSLVEQPIVSCFPRLTPRSSSYLVSRSYVSNKKVACEAICSSFIQMASFSTLSLFLITRISSRFWTMFVKCSFVCTKCQKCRQKHCPYRTLSALLCRVAMFSLV